MSRSANDSPIWGGSIRMKCSKTESGRIQIRAYLINAKTGQPYRYVEIKETLLRRKEEYPHLADAVEKQLAVISEKEHRRKGANVLSYYSEAENPECLAEKKDALQEQLKPLAKLLFRPQFLEAVRNGNCTLAEFVDYFEDTLYASITVESALKGVRSSMKTKILPAIGSDRIEIYIRGEDAKEKALDRIAHVLDEKLVQENVRQYTNQALHLLFAALDEYGVPLKGGAYLPRRRFEVGTRKNYDVGKQLLPDHLDEDARERFFAFLAADPRYLAELLWSGLIYSGLPPSEIGALHYSDITPYSVLNGEQPTGELIFTCLVTKTLQKTSDTYWRTVDITMKEFVMPKARRIVLVPWLTGILRRMIAALHAAGVKDSDMLLSMGCDGSPNTPDDICRRLENAMQASQLFSPQKITRQSKTKAYLSSYPATIRLIESDARYVASHICGMPLAAYHRTFGIAATMTDEQHYLDTLSPDFAWNRYYYLRRFYPKVFLPPSANLTNEDILAVLPSLIQLTVSGDTENDGELIIDTDLGVDIAWETK